MIWQIVSGLVGLSGLALGIWNRVEQWRESKRKRAENLPVFTAVLDHREVDGWRTLRLAILNPGNANFVMTRVDVISPRDCWIAPRVEVVGEDPELQSMNVEWRVYAQSKLSAHEVVSSTTFRCKVAGVSRPKLAIAGYIVKSGRPHFKEPVYVSLPGEKTEVHVR